MTEIAEPQATPPPASTPWVPMWSLNPTGVDLRYQGDYLPGSYTDGDIVVFQGVAYLCVRPTGSAPVPWTPPQQVPTYGTSFPANPVDGQEHVLVDSVTAATYTWRFRYNAQRSSNKWEFIGGAPLSLIASSGVWSPTGAAGWNWLSPALRFLVPRGGVWFAAAGTQSQSTGGDTLQIGVGNGSTQAGPQVAWSAAGSISPSGSVATTVNVAAGDGVYAWYYGSLSAAFANRWLAVTPVALT